MNLLILTHVPHIIDKNQYFAYSPYVREMNVWGKFVEEMIIVAPLNQNLKTEIDIEYNHKNIKFIKIKSFNLIGFKAQMNAFLKIPKIIFQIFKAMKNADHIHLRCPGNIGLLGCLVQILFPSKSKTAKYAGNWDPNTRQPYSYKLQQWLLNNTFLTKNMQVLVYGEWAGSSRNIKPFFTATYQESEIKPLIVKNFNGCIKFVIVGTLVDGKNPLFAIQLIENLNNLGYEVSLNLYGDGILKEKLHLYITEKNLQDIVFLNGNQNKETIKKAYQDSHFVVLPSESEGWPKAVAEGMFWGCVPVSSPVSCVPFMLDFGKRGVLLKMDLKNDTAALSLLLKNEQTFQTKSKLAKEWSNIYTLDFFEQEIRLFLQR